MSEGSEKGCGNVMNKEEGRMKGRVLACERELADFFLSKVLQVGLNNLFRIAFWS